MQYVFCGNLPRVRETKLGYAIQIDSPLGYYSVEWYETMPDAEQRIEEMLDEDGIA